MEWYQVLGLLVVGFILGALWGIWVGLKAFASQRNRISHHLQELDDHVDMLSKLMHDGRIAPDVLHGWIAAIRMEFLPPRKWRE